MKIKTVILSVVKNLSRIRVFNSDIRQRFLVALLLGMTIVSPVYALDSTPSADIKSKLEELKKEIASKAANLKQELNKKLQNKAYVGNIKIHSSTSLTLASPSGAKLINLNEDTVFESQIKTKKASVKSLANEDYIAALGDIDETGVLTAKKIIFLTKPKKVQKTYFWGKVISSDDKLVTVLDYNLKNIALAPTPDVNLKPGDFIIVTGAKNENDIFEAEFVYIIPQGGIIKPKKVATPSASIKSASPYSGKK